MPDPSSSNIQTSQSAADFTAYFMKLRNLKQARLTTSWWDVPDTRCSVPLQTLWGEFGPARAEHQAIHGQNLAARPELSRLCRSGGVRRRRTVTTRRADR